MKKRVQLICTIFFILLLTACHRKVEVETSSLFLKERHYQKTIPYQEEKVPFIVIDPGHGGDDEGCSPQDLVDEKELTLTTATLVTEYLEEMGYQVYQTRTKDIPLSLSERVRAANHMGSDLFVSVHFNAAKNNKAHGIEVFYCQEHESERSIQSKELAEAVIEKMIAFTKAKSRGVKTAKFRVIKETKMPAILVEGGFLSNKDERKKCQDPLYQEAIAWGIARGVHEYLKKHNELFVCYP